MVYSFLDNLHHKAYIYSNIYKWAYDFPLSRTSLVFLSWDAVHGPGQTPLGSGVRYDMFSICSGDKTNRRAAASSVVGYMLQGKHERSSSRGTRRFQHKILPILLVLGPVETDYCVPTKLLHNIWIDYRYILRFLCNYLIKYIASGGQCAVWW